MPTPLVVECELSAFLFSHGLDVLVPVFLKTSGSLSVKDEFLSAKVAKNLPMPSAASRKSKQIALISHDFGSSRVEIGDFCVFLQRVS